MNVRNVKNAARIWRLVGLFLLVSTLSACTTKQATPVPLTGQWSDYTYPEQGFSVSFPVEPSKTEKDDGITFLAQSPDGLFVYTVVVSKGPGVGLAKFTFDLATEQFGEKVKSTRDIELQGFPGRELTMEMEEQAMQVHITARMYLVGSRMYQVVVSAPKSKREDSEKKKFQDSFKLLVDKPK